MKKRILAIILSVIFILSAGTVYADDLWSEEYYRAADSTGELSDAQRDDLDATCLKFLQKWQLDLALLALPSDKYEELTIRELAEEYYLDCDFGYGETHDGFMMVFYTDTAEAVIVPMGAAVGRIPDDYLSFTAKSVMTYQENYGTYGPMYSTTKMLNDYLTDHAESSETAAAGTVKSADSSEKKDASDSEGNLVLTPEHESSADSLLDENGMPDPSLRVGENGSRPAWYPINPANFPEYHDPSAPRVVDNADIFTSSDEEKMEQRLSDLRQELDKDIVIYTDVTDYGFDELEYVADFYDFNGYGCGDNYEGVCIFINMNPNDRGWWTTTTGPISKGLYTEEIGNQIDDLLYEYMVAGKYTEGVADWIENCRRLYLTGSPYTPDWAADINNPSFTRTHNAAASRVIDEAHILSDDEIANLENKASQISKVYGLDVVIHTARNEAPFTRDQYSELYYYYNGYGLGDDYDGILLTVFKRPYDDPATSIYASGLGLKNLSETNRDRLQSRCLDLLEDHQYYAAMDQWLDQTGHMLKTGRAPKSASDWSFTLVLELVIGIVIGIISLSRAKASMATPHMKENADSYFIPGSLRIRKVRDTHTGTSTTRTYSPIEHENRSSGGGSSGRSTYRSSYTGSSGRSHTGSGRRF